MSKKIIFLVAIIILLMILNDIFAVIDLVWYIQLLPLAILILISVILKVKDLISKSN
ncbi:hypothetical protein [Clostridium tertium]|uniref:Uncharacterized protein n=1 Tax=Clostridium tertium TaxID=1559 RepID=A0A6N3DVK5_9CLOT